MQRTDKAVETLRLIDASKKREPGEGDEKANLQMEIGKRLAANFMKILTQPPQQDMSVLTSEERHAHLLERLTEGMEGLDLKDAEVREQIDAVATKIGTLIENSKVEQTPPPRDVPQDLTAQEYYDLGVQYKTIGWTEQARDALTYSFELDPDGDIGKRARRYLQTKIPRHPVPLVAEQRNVEGFNERMSGQIRAAQLTFEKLIEDYPQFEWPYGNLGSIYIMQGKLDLAKRILKKALEINAYYVNARLHLCRAQILASEFDDARKNLEAVSEIDPDTPVQELSATLEKIATWEK